MRKKIFMTIYTLMILLAFLDGFTSFEIKSQIIKDIVWYNLLVGHIIVFILAIIFIRRKRNKLLCLFFPIIMALFFYFYIGPMRILFSIGAWQTQVIYYKHKYLRNRTIEFQMQDIGALGYNRRTVKVIYLTKLFMIIKDGPKNIDEEKEWERVNIDINEMGLIYP